jgi:hypothetical protein
MQAYETHMQDVQKELFLLREKVHILKTDETRALKMKSLEDDQNKLKAESIQLDEENNELRKKLRALTVTMQSTERDRDWLLKKLRLAKGKFKRLEKQFGYEKTKVEMVGELSALGGDSLSMSKESSTYLAIRYATKKNYNSYPANTASIKLQRANDSHSGTKQVSNVQLGRRSEIEMRTTEFSENMSPAISNRFVPNPDHTSRRIKLEKGAVALLVAMRARQEGMRDMVDRCFKSHERASTLVLEREAQSRAFATLPELLSACLETISASKEDRDRKYSEEILVQIRRDLAAQLACHSQTYLAISDVLAGKYLTDKTQQLIEFVEDELPVDLRTILNLDFNG